MYSHDGRVITPVLPPGYRFVDVSPTTLEHYFHSEEDSWRLRNYTALLRSGALGTLIVAEDDNWASVGWVATPSSLHPPHIPKTVARNRYWTFNVHTAPKHRGKGLQKAGIRQRVALSREHARDESEVIYTDVRPSNMFSRKAKLSSGFTPAGLLYTTRIGIPGIRHWVFGHWDSTAPHQKMEFSSYDTPLT